MHLSLILVMNKLNAQILVLEEITKHSIAHTANLLQHTNQLIPILLKDQRPQRLKRYLPSDLPLRFFLTYDF